MQSEMKDYLEKELRANFDSFFHQVHFYVDVQNWYDDGIKKSRDNITTALTDLICRKLEGMRKQKEIRFDIDETNDVNEGAEYGYQTAINEAIKMVRE